MKIAYFPFENNTNKYIQLSKTYLEANGCELVDFEKIDFNNIQKIDAVFFNWFESVSEKWTIKALNNVLKKIKIIKKLKQNQVKIVFTFHNRISHGKKSIFNKMVVKKGMSMMYSYADAIILLSRDSRKYLREIISEEDAASKEIYIPHPNYIGCYTKPIKDNIYVKHEKFQVLFVGAVKPYKNVELIIETAKKFQNYPIHFTIAGGCTNEYASELEKLAVDQTNISLELHFIEDDKLDCMIRNADILLLPYNIESSMNSGTVLLAFSNGRTVICPDISTLHDFCKNDYYSYTYNDKVEHFEHLIEQVEIAFNDWKNNREDFEKKGTDLLEEVKIKNSKQIILDGYRRLLKKLEID